MKYSQQLRGISDTLGYYTMLAGSNELDVGDEFPPQASYTSNLRRTYSYT